MAKQDDLMDHFAGLAMAAVIISSGQAVRNPVKGIVKSAHEYAAAMMEESERTQPPKGKRRMKITRLGPD